MSIKTIVAAILLAASAILYFTVINLSDSNSSYVYQIRSDEIISIEIVSDLSTSSVSKVGDVWMLQDNYADEDMIDGIIRQLLWLPVTRKIGMVQNQNDFGLETPAVIVSFSTKSGDEYRLIIGQEIAGTQNRYVKDDKRNLVYIVQAGFLQKFFISEDEIRDKRILAVDTNRLAMVECFINDTTNKIQRNNEGQWMIYEPFIANANPIKIQNSLQEITQMRAKKYFDGLLSEYGFDQPYCKLFLKDLDERTQTFYFVIGDDNVIYAVSDKTDGIYTLSHQLNLEDLNAIQWLGESPFSIPLSNMVALDLTIDSSSYSFESNEQNLITLNGISIDQEDFSTLYFNLMALCAEGYERFTPSEPYLIINCKYIDGENRSVTLYKRDENSYYMGFDGRHEFYTSSDKVDIIIRWLYRLE